MPRKYKTAFSATDEDIAITGIHDGGFIPRVKDGRRGFEIRIGGGTSIMPRVAPTLYEFVGADDGEYLKVTEAVLRIFNRQDELRANRARARIKVLIDRIGIDAFREMVEEELRGDWVAERDFDPQPILFRYDEEAGAPPLRSDYVTAPVGVEEFERFVAQNTLAQRQEGFVSVEVKVVRGDLTPEQLRGLATILREYSGGYARTTVQQNLVLRWVRPESLYEVWVALGEIGLAGVGPRTVADIVSCPGTDSCKLGITSSMGLSAAIQERIDSLAIEDPLTRQVNIKMSGCPNGCGQHHIANIGFTGASIKIGERTLPAYIPLLAGNFADGTVAMGQRLKSRLPAKRVPEAVERWLTLYQSERTQGEAFNDFVARIGTTRFEQLVKDLALPPEFSLESMNQFMDWNRSEPFVVVRGEGECAV
jgi:sulfite reductase beta subunit-like hemoprotein